MHDVWRVLKGWPMEIAAITTQEVAEHAAEHALPDFDPDDLVEALESKDIPVIASETTSYDPDDLVDFAVDGIESGPAESEGYDPDDLVTPIEEKVDSSSEIRLGKRVYLDDLNRIYRVDDELIPNNEYTINGYKYTTDDMGRITSAEGQVSLRSRDRQIIKDGMEAIGKGSQRDTDDRGHLIADSLNGSNGLENIVPMDRELNRGAFKKLEYRLADAAGNGCEVSYRVEPRYSDDSHRPSSFVVTDVIDGETTITVFRNEGKADHA